MSGMRALEFVQDLGDPDKVEERLLANGDNPAYVRDLAFRLRETWGDFKHFRGLELRKAIKDASSEVYGGAHSVDLKAEYELTPRWKSTIDRIDFGEHGGFYGTVVLGGTAGAGKSMLAAASAVAAAQNGDKVVFLYSEMSQGQIAGRVKRAGQSRIGDHTHGNLFPKSIYAPMQFDDIVSAILASLSPDDEALLVVVDSINTLVDMLQESAGVNAYFRELNRVINFFVTARRLTEGRIRSILISELNKEGGIKGQKPEYSSDMTVRLMKTDTPDQVNVTVTKGREGGAGDMGLHSVDWKNGRLVSA